jgi:hypothetical protein
MSERSKRTDRKAKVPGRTASRPVSEESDHVIVAGHHLLGRRQVHVPESCEPEQPHLITHVEMTAGPIADAAVTNAIHEQLQAQPLLPRLHTRAPARPLQQDIVRICQGEATSSKPPKDVYTATGLWETVKASPPLILLSCARGLSQFYGKSTTYSNRQLLSIRSYNCHLKLFE